MSQLQCQLLEDTSQQDRVNEVVVRKEGQGLFMPQMSPCYAICIVRPTHTPYSSQSGLS